MRNPETGRAGQAARFLEWLTVATAEAQADALRDDGLSLIELAELACAYAERAFERAGGPQRAKSLDCRRGCDYCCHLPVETSRAEASRALEFARENLNAAEFRDLKHRIREAAAAYPLSPQRPPAENPRCPFLEDSACRVYPARPLACRGWNSRDASACRSAHERGVSEVTVPVDSRIRGVFANASEALLRGLTHTQRDGPTHLVPALAALIVLERG
ncbi:MAG TPA: YkgJ family cysteine cluster protein [Gammaproteobacteria bacterium]|nr:YkgJ family cysteine cluster protein [Gammaproteobacteria bacterium]